MVGCTEDSGCPAPSGVEAEWADSTEPASRGKRSVLGTRTPGLPVDGAAFRFAAKSLCSHSFVPRLFPIGHVLLQRVTPPTETMAPFPVPAQAPLSQPTIFETPTRCRIG